MGSPRKTVADETRIPTADALYALLLLRCKELKLATSGLKDKIPGVKTDWLHSLSRNRQKTVDTSSLFPLIEGLGLEVVIRKKVTKSDKPAGNRMVHAMLTSQAAGLALSDAERAEAAEALGESEPEPEVEDDLAGELPPEIQAARRILFEYQNGLDGKLLLMPAGNH